MTSTALSKTMKLFSISEGYFSLPTTLSHTNQLAILEVYDGRVKMSWMLY